MQGKSNSKKIIAKSHEKKQEDNKKVTEIPALTGVSTAEQALKAINNTEGISNMWKKVAYVDKGKTDNKLSSISIPLSWPDMHTPVTAT
eukprot:14176840-Ditylum_brightwellii.AAC.1